MCKSLKLGYRRELGKKRNEYWVSLKKTRQEKMRLCCDEIGDHQDAQTRGIDFWRHKKISGRRCVFWLEGKEKRREGKLKESRVQVWGLLI